MSQLNQIMKGPRICLTILILNKNQLMMINQKIQGIFFNKYKKIIKKQETGYLHQKE
jgi:hypothetical protein